MTNKIRGENYFSRKTKMANVINANFHLLSVIRRFGIELGFGDKTIEKVCSDNELNVDFVLLILNSFQKSETITNINYSFFDIELLIDYLIKTHDYYNKAIIPALNGLIKDVYKHSQEATKVALLQRFYKQYIRELKEHIEYEEKIVFPYIRMLNAVLKNEVNSSEMADIEYRISMFKVEHANIENKLFDLKNILIKYYTIPDDEIIVHTLYLLFRFEKDIRYHALLEEELMIPFVEIIEKQVFPN